MAESTYSYTISNDFPPGSGNGKVNEPVLREEILGSSISSSLIRIVRDDDNLDIVFDPALSAGDKTTLDGDTLGPAGGLIASHDADEDLEQSNDFVIDKDLSSPPVSPDLGDKYIVGPTATGAWKLPEPVIGPPVSPVPDPTLVTVPPEFVSNTCHEPEGNLSVYL